MQAHIDSTHKRLGQLAAMSRQTQDAERDILNRAKVMLANVEKDLPAAASASMMGGADKYQDLIAERGRLQQVIAQARQVLGE